MPRKDFNLTVLISIDFPKRLCNSDVFMEKCQEKESNALDEGWLKLVYCLDSFDYHWVLLVTQLYCYTVLAILQVPVGLGCLSVMWNRPLPSSNTPHFQNEAKCRTFLMKMSFICMRIKNHFHIIGWVLNLFLIQRPGETRKWPVASRDCFGDSQVFLIGHHKVA